MLSYDTDDDSLIISCLLDEVSLKDVSPEETFSVGSKWKGWSLLYSTVQAHDAATGSKVTLLYSIFDIQFSRYNQPVQNRKEIERKFTSDHYVRTANGKSESVPQ